MSTRSRENIYLINHDEIQIIGCKLPSNVQVLRVLFYNIRKVNLDLRASANLVVKEIEIHWNKARIPTRNFYRSVSQVEGLYREWKTLQKTCKRRTALQIKREELFLDKMDNLFDIAHVDALEIMTIEEDKAFLTNQRKKGRPGSMIGCDRILTAKEEKMQMLQEKENLRRANQKNIYEKIVELESSSSEEDELILNSEQAEDNNTSSEHQQSHSTQLLESCQYGKRKQQHFITNKLVATLDKCKVSDRNAVRILIAAAQALNHDLDTLVISKSSIRRCRKKVRSETAYALQDQFNNTPLGAVTVHWDGKILPDLTGREKVDRLPVLITSDTSEHLLGIPKLTAGTGKEQANAILDLLNDWKVIHKVQALCCDTTASNMGRLKGCSILLEQEIGRELLYLPCRHHIYEIVLRSVFENAGLDAFGPTLSIFKRFQECWDKIDRKKYLSG